VRARGRQVQWYRHNVNRRDEARHNDSNAAVLTKMQKEMGDRGRSLRGPSYIVRRGRCIAELEVVC